MMESSRIFSAFQINWKRLQTRNRPKKMEVRTLNIMQSLNDLNRATKSDSEYINLETKEKKTEMPREMSKKKVHLKNMAWNCTD